MTSPTAHLALALSYRGLTCRAEGSALVFTSAGSASRAWRWLADHSALDVALDAPANTVIVGRGR